MKRHEKIADALRGAYWMHSAGQGESYLTWEELNRVPSGEKVQEYWLAIARTFEARLERESLTILQMIGYE